MGWKYRKGKPYYYRNERIGNKVVSHYCGPAGSDYARLWMSVDQIDRERRAQDASARAAARAELAALARVPDDLARLQAQACAAVAAALTAAGYRQHKRGEWRKRRGHKDKDETTEERS